MIGQYQVNAINRMAFINIRVQLVNPGHDWAGPIQVRCAVCNKEMLLVAPTYISPGTQIIKGKNETLGQLHHADP